MAELTAAQFFSSLSAIKTCEQMDGLGVQATVALSKLRSQAVLAYVKNIHLYAKDKAACNSVN